jgi:hypothetical protein
VGNKKGVVWMATRQISAGLPLMISDERYEEHALIINLSLMERIEMMYLCMKLILTHTIVASSTNAIIKKMGFP